MKYFKTCILIFCLAVGVCSSGQVNKPASLKVGDTLPDVQINHVINFPRSSIRLADFKGKLLIIDFWATWCAPCIASFSKFDSLQKKFGDELMILSVTEEDKDYVADFLRKLKQIKQVKPVSVTSDKKLKGLFPHTFLPHYVWVDKAGKVIGITENNQVTDKNISAILKGKLTSLVMRSETPAKVVARAGEMVIRPGVLLQSENETRYKVLDDTAVLFHSAITRYVEGLFSGGLLRGNVVTIQNSTIEWLYKIALWKGGTSALNSNRILIEIKDTALFEQITGRNTNGASLVKPGMESVDWLRRNGYTYEIKVPESLNTHKFDLMLEDLNRYFGRISKIQGSIEERVVPYLALVKLGTDSLFSTRGGEPSSDKNKLFLKITNKPISALISALGLPLQDYPPVLDETGYIGSIDIEINSQLSDLNSLNKELLRYGLKLIEKQKLMDVAIIKEL